MANTTETKPVIETTSESLVGLYTMYYRAPQVSNTLISKNFRFNGNLHDAKERAEEYCSIMGLRLNFVQPLISDLKKEEEFKLRGYGTSPQAPPEVKNPGAIQK